MTSPTFSEPVITFYTSVNFLIQIVIFYKYLNDELSLYETLALSMLTILFHDFLIP